jgi:hypothetical protein
MGKIKVSANNPKFGAGRTVATPNQNDSAIESLIRDRAVMARMADRLFEFYSDELGGVPLSTTAYAESLLEDVLRAAIARQ